MENQTQKSKTSSVLIDDQKKIFIPSCPFRIEDIDRNVIIKRQDMESCLKRLSTREDIYGMIIATMDSRILYECDTLKNWIPVLSSLCSLARHLVRNNDPNDNIQAIRLRTKNYEIIITIRNEQLLIIMQMLSNTNTNNMIKENNIIEEDWETFLKRIH